MNLRKLSLMLLFGFLSLVFAACGGGDSDGTVTKLRFSGIPDENKDELISRYSVVTDFLAKELGIDVEFIVMTDYTAAVTSLASNKVDLVWLGGVTSVQAEQRTDGDVTFVACRDTDLQFKSYFIAHESLGLSKVSKLEDLKPALGENSFTFGSKNSTSGHIMPRFFMTQAGINPETDIEGGPKYQLRGGHSATLEAVASGSVGLGALNYTVWDKADSAKKTSAPVVYETPPYVDYCMVAHNRLGDEIIGKIADAFASLENSNPEHAEVLAAFSAEKFVKANPADWDGIRDVLATPAVQEAMK